MSEPIPELAVGTVVKFGGKVYRLLTPPSTYGDSFTGIEVTFDVTRVDSPAPRVEVTDHG